jgi:hypothetical protein
VAVASFSKTLDPVTLFCGGLTSTNFLQDAIDVNAKSSVMIFIKPSLVNAKMFFKNL